MRKRKYFLALALLSLIVMMGCHAATTSLAPGGKKISVMPALPKAEASEKKIMLASGTEELQKFFSEFEKCWNDQDVEAYMAMWMDGATLITRSKKHHIIRHNGGTAANFLGQMKREGTYRYRLLPKTIEIHENSANAIVDFTSSRGNQLMIYDLVKEDGGWLIKKQQARPI